MMADRPIWQTNRRAFVEKLARCAQKARSVLLESLGEENDDLLTMLNPWLFGKKCILPSLEVLSEQDNIAPEQILNLSFVIDKTPALASQMIVWGVDIPDPEQVIEWIGLERMGPDAKRNMG